MALIDLKSDLKTLKYSEFGTIGDPLVVKDVNNPPKYNSAEKQITSRTDDLLRITRLLTLQGGKRNPAGNKFTANLALINQQETLSKIQKRDFQGLGRTFLDGAASTAKTIGSILAQVPVSGTGIHFVNGGVLGKEYLQGGGSPLGQFLRTVTGSGNGLQGHERVLSGRPIIINKEEVDSNPTSLRSRYENKISNLDQVDQVEGNTFFRNPPETIKTRLRYQGDQGKFPGGSPDAVDEINASDIYESDFFRDKDIIPFEFQVFDPKNGELPKYLYFRAYLQSLQDNFSSDWNSTKYVGRAEQLYNYTGFNRGITLSFIVAAHTQNELMPLYKKLNYLVGTTGPSYDTNQTFMRGVFTKLSVGDYLTRVPGFFKSVDLSWTTAYPWEVGLNRVGDVNGLPKVPHLLDISLTFQPIHNFNPELGKPFITNEQFIPQGRLQGDGAPRVNIEAANIGVQPPQRNLADLTVNPPTSQGRLRSFTNSAREFIQKVAGDRDGNPEAVKTINIQSDTTTFPLD